MSDQPDDPHNLQNRIPRFRQILLRLIQLLNSEGYTLDNLVITPSTDPPTQTSIIYNQTPTPTTTSMAILTQPLPTPPSTTPFPPFQHPSLPSPRPKRASTSLLDPQQQQTPPKRKRFSDPRPFWGTVLEHPTQLPPPPPPPQQQQQQQPPLTPPYIPPLHPTSPQRLHRTTTLPTPLPRTPPLPSITSQLPHPHQIEHPPTDRSFLRAAGHLLGRLSPFRRHDHPQPSPFPQRFQPLPTFRYPTQVPSADASSTSAPPQQPTVSPTQDRGRRGRRPAPQPEHDQFFECELCDSKFKRKSDKNRHVRVVHEKSRPFTCPLCSKTFGEKSNMLKHRASVHDDVRTFRCPYCELSFSQRGLCDTHVRTVHDKKQAKYFCEYCGLPFSRKVQLHEHYQSDHPEYMASYATQPSGVQLLPSSRIAPQPIRERGGPAPRDPFPTRSAQPRPSMPRRGEAGPSSAPQQWLQYQQSTIQQEQPRTTLPQLQAQTSNGMHQLPEVPPRPKGYNDESSGNGT